MCFAPGCFRLNICPPKSHAEPPGASYGTQIDAVAAQWRYPKIYPPVSLKRICLRAGSLINPTRDMYLVTYLKLWSFLFWDHLRIGLDELRRLSLLSRHVDNGNTFIFFIFFRFPPKKSTSDHTIRDMNPGPLGPNQTPRAAQWGLMMKLGGGFAGI